MLSCKEVSELASLALDTPLSLEQRWRMGLHLLMCRLCARYVKQLAFLHRYLHQLDTHFQDANLSQEAKDRIKAALK